MNKVEGCSLYFFFICDVQNSILYEYIIGAAIMIRELINNFDIEVGHLEIEVTEQKPDEFTCVISIFDSSGDC